MATPKKTRSTRSTPADQTPTTTTEDSAAATGTSPTASAGIPASNATDVGSARQTLEQSNQVAPSTSSPADVEGDPVSGGGYFSTTVSSDQEHSPTPETPGQTGQAFISAEGEASGTS